MKDMISFLEKDKVEDLFSDIPDEIKDKAEIKNISESRTELEFVSYIKELTAKTRKYKNFIGGGVYHHYIPAAVESVLSRGEFVTPYTPYQPEVSQGILQTIFEYQTTVCELTGMDVSNASLYDGGSALAEAILLLSRKNPSAKKIYYYNEINPFFINTAKTYTQFKDFIWNKYSDEIPDTAETLCLIIQNPDFTGKIIEMKDIDNIKNKYPELKIIYIFEPISSSILKTPGEIGADIAVGEGIGCGMPISAGGPGLGLFACKKEYLRLMPGRIIGETIDKDGKRVYTLTLQTREQHIRREKATSNICTNQSLNAIAFTLFFTYLGRSRLKKLAKDIFDKSHKLYDKLKGIDKIKVSDYKFFNEFIIEFEEKDSLLKFYRISKENGIYPGIILENIDTKYKNQLLIAVTEIIEDKDIDRYVERLKD